MKIKTFFILLGLLNSSAVWSAACCGGGASFPSLITQDVHTQIGVALTRQQRITEPFNNGKIQKISSDTDDFTNTFGLSIGHLISERIQVGITPSFVKKEFKQGSSTKESSYNLGDTDLQLAWEFLPQTLYSPWIPQAFWFIKQTLPTGKSSLDSVQKTGIDRYLLSTGLVFLKTIESYDVQFMSEVHYYFPKNSVNQEDKGKFGGAILLGGGYNFAKLPFRLGLSISPKFERPESRMTYGHKSEIPKEYYVDTSLQLSYFWQEYNLSTSVTYLDQTIIPYANNTSLSRSITLLAQKRWLL